MWIRQIGASILVTLEKPGVVKGTRVLTPHSKGRNGLSQRTLETPHDQEETPGSPFLLNPWQRTLQP